jgi:hypothetical protein
MAPEDDIGLGARASSAPWRWRHGASSAPWRWRHACVRSSRGAGAGTGAAAAAVADGKIAHQVYFG